MKTDTPLTPHAGRLVRVSLDESSVGVSPLQEAERARAIDDLQAEAWFVPVLRGVAAPDGGEYDLHLSVSENRLVFDVRRTDGTKLVVHVLALGPFRSVLRDYQLLVASHAAAIEDGRDARLQAIDMGRRGLHDEGARMVVQRLDGKIGIDFATARRLFTLLCVLQQRG